LALRSARSWVGAQQQGVTAVQRKGGEKNTTQAEGRKLAQPCP